MKRDSAPKSLSSKARGWWRELVGEFVLDDSGSRLVLEQALLAWDRAEEARSAIERDGAAVKDRFGQTQKHPLLGVERDSRAQILQAFRSLNLDPGTMPRSKLGRPPGGRGGGL